MLVPNASDAATSTTNGTFDGIFQNEPFQMSIAADVAWTIIFSLMIGGAIIGNLVVFWIVLGK